MKLKLPEDLIVWQKAVELATEIYRVTTTFPKRETYGLTSQLRRSAFSLPDTIAQGQKRLSTGESQQFLGQARGSLHELQTQVRIAARLAYLKHVEAEALLNQAAEVGRTLDGLHASLSSSRDKTAA